MLGNTPISLYFKTKSVPYSGIEVSSSFKALTIPLEVAFLLLCLLSNFILSPSSFGRLFAGMLRRKRIACTETSLPELSL